MHLQHQQQENEGGDALERPLLDVVPSMATETSAAAAQNQPWWMHSGGSKVADDDGGVALPKSPNVGEEGFRFDDSSSSSSSTGDDPDL